MHIAPWASLQVSQEAQSTIYIDNWSSDFNITDNVVDDCPHVEQGYYYFQVRHLRRRRRRRLTI